MVHITITCCSNSCCHADICQAASDFDLISSTSYHLCATARSCCDTRLRGSHQTYGLPTDQTRNVFIRNSKGRQVVDELWLLTEYYYISQGMVKTPIMKGSFVEKLFRYLCAKNYEIPMQFDQVIAKVYIRTYMYRVFQNVRFLLGHPIHCTVLLQCLNIANKYVQHEMRMKNQ